VSLVPNPKPVTIEMIPERFAKIVIKQRPKIDKMGIKGDKDEAGGSKMGEGGRPQGPEGKVGKPELADKKETPQAILPKSTPKEKPQVAAPSKAPAPTPQRKLVDQNKAKSVGLMKAFSQGGVQKDLKALIDKGDGPEGPGGFDDFGKAVSGLRGKTIEESGGAGGKGLKGVDVGGGGKTVGIDGPSTKGLGRGSSGDGIGEGISGPGRLGIKGEHAISIISENVQVLSGLPKDVINAVVQRHRSEIRACYDAALQRNPNLRGKVSMAFNIQPNGVVSYAAVKESSLGDAGLEGCIVSRVKTWLFPKPEAPVVTEVTAYPFYLSPAN
jgi:outer membrane biosynthesis protein TonB